MVDAVQQCAKSPALGSPTIAKDSAIDAVLSSAYRQLQIVRPSEILYCGCLKLRNVLNGWICLSKRLSSKLKSRFALDLAPQISPGAGNQGIRASINR